MWKQGGLLGCGFGTPDGGGGGRWLYFGCFESRIRPDDVWMRGARDKEESQGCLWCFLASHNRMGKVRLLKRKITGEGGTRAWAKRSEGSPAYSFPWQLQKLCTLGSFKQQGFIPSRFWRLEGQPPSGSRAALPPEPLGMRPGSFCASSSFGGLAVPLGSLG